ncbi:hypothetical protein EVS87_012075 [Bacillus altitudinis]|uniref:hypothetical protein n=1 Tax=Bacillus altitudinis TaxID=293387 RepID=UPI0010725AA5|nr:hypothetical protein [Bacillus altitudinis]MBR0581190.1 hypothetical protein [Bacillus altitudinis A23-8]QEO62927.1 hypothetical protein EVS87_012075 [Bacillus altitudinis]
MSGGEAEDIKIKMISVCFLVCASFLILLTGCGGVKVSELDEDIGYDFSDSTVGKFKLGSPKDTKTIEVNYQGEIKDVKVDIEKVHFAKEKIGISLTFKNNSKDKTYLVASTILRINSDKILGPKDLVYVDQRETNSMMDQEGAVSKTVSYWPLGDMDFKDVKEIDLQVYLFEDFDSSDGSYINIKRKISL